MTNRHDLLGFGKETGAVRQQWLIPSASEDAVAHILRMGTTPLAMIDPRELTAQQAERVGAAIGQRIDPVAHDYFMQAFDEAPATAAGPRAGIIPGRGWQVGNVRGSCRRKQESQRRCRKAMLAEHADSPNG